MANLQRLPINSMKTRLRLALLYFGLCIVPAAHAAQLVMVIDDVGNNYAQGHAMVTLEGPLTLAFLPHTPHAKNLAEEAYKNGKEVILHAPMENSVDFPLGPGALTQDLSKAEFQQTLTQAITATPHIQGVNNHMGSALTQNTQAMAWVMEVLKKQQLYFIDSLTSAKSVAYQQALHYQLPALRRQVFLDNDKSEAGLTRQWNKALNIAKAKGSVVLIGHPYDESHAFLAQQLPKLAAEGVELIPASQLFLQNAWQEFEVTDIKKPGINVRLNRYDLNQDLTVESN